MNWIESNGQTQVQPLILLQQTSGPRAAHRCPPGCPGPGQLGSRKSKITGAAKAATEMLKTRRQGSARVVAGGGQGRTAVQGEGEWLENVRDLE